MAERRGPEGLTQPIGDDPRLAAVTLARRRRAARARTLQLVEWFGFALIVLGVELLLGPAWAIVAAGVACVVIANAA